VSDEGTGQGGVVTRTIRGEETTAADLVMDALPIGGARAKGGSAISSSAGSNAKRSGLTAEQAKNLKRFDGKLPAGAGETSIHDLPAGGRAFQAEVPGKVPGSKAIYEKQVGAAGETLQYTKTTMDPAGRIVHVKDKISGTVVTP
jgi:hypothetical protein